MQIAKVIIRNILGIERLEFAPGKFTAVTGRNGTGKTSVLESIKGALKGGHDATLLRNGATDGEAVLVLDDGTTISKKVTADGSKQTVTLADGRRASSPAATLQALTDLFSVNPIDFLRANAKTRATVLLESMPIKLDEPRILGAIGGETIPGAGLTALEQLESCRKQVYDARTGTNRAMKEKQATISQLQSALPDEAEVPKRDIAELTALKAQMEATRDECLARIDAKLNALRNERDGKISEAQRFIDEVLKKADEMKEAARNEFNLSETKANAAREKTRATYAEQVKPANDAMALVTAHAAASGRRAQTRDTIERLTVEAGHMREESDKQTAALESLEAYKAELLAKLPIKGLTVVDGDVQRDGIKFDRLNTAQQVAIAVEIAKLRAGKLNLVCVDGLESLDPIAFEEFKKQTMESGLQLIVSKVDAGDFNVSVS